LNLAEIAECGARSVVSSWLLDLTAMALIADANLTDYTGLWQDSGEGRWTIMASGSGSGACARIAVSALYTRFRSRQEHTYAEKILVGHCATSSGWHVERPAGG